jgi:probable rRNA maturation factor
MSKNAIHFFTEDIIFTLKQKSEIRNWILNTVKNESYRLKELNYIFCSDEYLLGINRQYLNHDTYTDIITFDTSEEERVVVGDVFISIDRIKENADKFKSAERDELHRVMIHGVLHLLGYTDKGKKEKAQMTDKENQYLGLRNF